MAMYKNLDETAKWKALIWFNSEYDAYGVNGTKEYEPCDTDALADISDSNGWEWTWSGERIYDYERICEYCENGYCTMCNSDNKCCGTADEREECAYVEVGDFFNVPEWNRK